MDKIRKPQSAEHRRKISEANKGYQKKLGYKTSEETKRKIGLANKGRKPWTTGKKMPPEVGAKISNARKLRFKRLGYLNSPETRLKQSLAQRGEKSLQWKGGITPEHEAIRRSREYRYWRKAVLERDNYTCIWCFKTGVSLNADHIKPFALYPELRFAIDNGRTLCVPCHKKSHQIT